MTKLSLINYLNGTSPSSSWHFISAYIKYRTNTEIDPIDLQSQKEYINVLKSQGNLKGLESDELYNFMVNSALDWCCIHFRVSKLLNKSGQLIKYV